MHAALVKALNHLPEDTFEALLALNSSELNTLLLEVFRQRVASTTPAEMLKRSAQNRFVVPAQVHPIALRTTELKCLELAEKAGFECVELGPVAPLGVSSVYGKINQNNVLSGLRQCEVIADPSNHLCLLICQEIAKKEEASLSRFCSHRTLRTAFFEGPLRFAHFQMLAGCSVLYTRDIERVLDCVEMHLQVQKEIFSHWQLPLHYKMWIKTEQEALGEALYKRLHTNHDCQRMPEDESQYYQGFQLKTFARDAQGQEVELADCGWVPWARELRGDKYFHTLISGIGLERLILLDSQNKGANA